MCAGDRGGGGSEADGGCRGPHSPGRSGLQLHGRDCLRGLAPVRSIGGRLVAALDDRQLEDRGVHHRTTAAGLLRDPQHDVVEFARGQRVESALVLGSDGFDRQFQLI